LLRSALKEKAGRQGKIPDSGRLALMMGIEPISMILEYAVVVV